ncbi:MAG: TadE family protein [Novosphingobium sp.]
MPKAFGRLLRETRGSVIVEAAFALPIVFLFGFGIMEIGRGMWIQNSLQFAVEAAARCAAIDSINCGSTGGIQAVAVAAAAGTDVTTSNFAYESLSCGKQVTATYNFSGNIPGLAAFSPVLTASSCFPT